MTSDQKKRAILINRHLYKACNGIITHETIDDSDITELIEAVSLILQDEDFQQVLAKGRQDGKPFQMQTNADLYALCFAYLKMLLMNRNYEMAAMILWGEETFTCEPRSVRMIWGALYKQRLINVLGASSMGKTYSGSAWMLLDWVLDPDWTMVRVMSTKEDHVKKNLFADMQRLHRQAMLPLPGVCETESIATPLGKRESMGIFILTIAGGSGSPASIKGSCKLKPRPFHPLFGTSSRSRLLIDEAQEVNERAWGEVSNLFSYLEEGDNEHLKIMATANPSDEFSIFGKNCKPTQGWGDIQTKDSEIDEWMGETGWYCVRLNAMKSENVISGKTVFQRFFTAEGYRTKLRQYGGDIDHPLMWAEVYGMFPAKGNMSTVIQKHHIDRSYGEWLFETETICFAGMDVALTGDQPVLATGRAGMAVAWMDFNGKRHDLKDKAWKLQIDTAGALPHGDTQDIADEIMSRLKILGVKPSHFAIDRTGNGQGVSDIVKRQWVEKVGNVNRLSVEGNGAVDILGVGFKEMPTECRIAEEDTKSPRELYTCMADELWFGAGRYIEYDVVRIGRGIDLMAIEELVTRKGGPHSSRSKLSKVESKEEYKKRLHRSPDYADAITLLIFAARMNLAHITPKAEDTIIPEKPREVHIDNNSELIVFEPAFDLGATANWGAGKIEGVDLMKD